MEIPKMVSTKDLSYIEDMANWNFVYAKKCNMYKTLVKDSDIQKLIENVGLMHKKHIELLRSVITK